MYELQPIFSSFLSSMIASLSARLVNVFAMIYISPPESQDRPESVLSRSLSEASSTA